MLFSGPGAAVTAYILFDPSTCSVFNLLKITKEPVKN